MICDAHCHLDLMNDMMGCINEIKNYDMYLYAVGTTPKAYEKEKQLCENYRNIGVGLGMHPQLVSSGYDNMCLFRNLSKKVIILVRWDLILVKDTLKLRKLK